MDKRFGYEALRKPVEGSRIIVSESKGAASTLLGTTEKEMERIVSRMEDGIRPTLAQMRRLYMLTGVSRQRVFQTEKELAEERKNSRIDTLTGLPNRAAFYEQVERVAKSMKRMSHVRIPSEARPLSALVGFMDFAGFKEINDTYGHETGDQIIYVGGNAASQSLRPEDSFGRLGGDEFGMLIVGSDTSNPIDHEAIARHINERIARDTAPLLAKAARGGVPLTVSADIGFVVFDGTESPDQVLSRADREMYKKKEARRAQKKS